jgi:hypothetical protein
MVIEPGAGNGVGVSGNHPYLYQWGNVVEPFPKFE